MLTRAPGAITPEDTSIQPVHRYVWSPTPVPTPPEAQPNLLAGRRVVVLGGTEVHRRTAMRGLERLGACIVADGQVDGIVDLNLLGEPFSPERASAWESPLRQSFRLLQAVYEDWVHETRADRLFYVAVTCLDGQMGYSDEPAVQPLGGIWAGLAKTLPREIPNCNVRVLDVASDDLAGLDEILAREVGRWGLFEIGYRRGCRYTLAADRSPLGPTTLELDSDDTVLFSGGGRGIGFACARALAREYGCRVVVTGRRPLAVDEPWLAMSERDVKVDRDEALRAAAREGRLGAMRRELEQRQRACELVRNIREARADGLQVEYHACDVNSAAELHRLVEAIGPGLSGVIHNAGVDSPVRLPAKTEGTFVDTVRVKVGGVLALLEACRGQPLKFFCSVGSLTGRLGGMVGQIDYGAANEGLTRIGLWAAREYGMSVKTVCWPTWERLGMVANYEATLKYMSPLAVDEGVRHWQRELLAAGRGEVTFMGTFGPALSPLHVMGYPPMLGMPEIGARRSDAFYLGQVHEFCPFQAVRSGNVLSASTAPCMHDVRICDAASLPVSLVLEFALSIGTWVTPEGWPALHLTEVRNLLVDVAALPAEAGAYTLDKQGTGRWQAGCWAVDVCLRTGAGRLVAQAQLIYDRHPRPVAIEPIPPLDAAQQLRLKCSPGWSRDGLVFDTGRWWGGGGETLIGEVRPAGPADLWLLPNPPDAHLPSAHLEAILGAEFRAPRWSMPPTRIAARRLVVWTSSTEPARFVLRRGDSWLILDSNGRLMLRIEGLTGLESAHHDRIEDEHDTHQFHHIHP